MTIDTAPPPATATLDDRVRAVLPVLHDEAGRVDETATFPERSVDALRTAGLMGLLVPAEYGGLGGDIRDLARIAVELAGACVSTAMIWTMHNQQVAAVVDHAETGLRRQLLPRVATGEVYIASVTSEKGTGGHLMTSQAPVAEVDGRLVIERDAPIVTGGAVAEGFLLTMQEGEGENAVSLVYADRDQVDVSPGRDSWNPMGMRATHSIPLHLSGTVPAGQRVGSPGEFNDVAVRTFAPAGHVGWAACWLGGVRAALRTVLSLVRDPAQRSRFDVGSDLLRERLARTRLEVDTVSALLSQVIDDQVGPAAPDDIGLQLRLNGLKVHAAEVAPRAVDRLIEIVGLRDGYMRHRPGALERLLRDLRSASLNYANDRLLNANGALCMLDRPVTLAL